MDQYQQELLKLIQSYNGAIIFPENLLHHFLKEGRISHYKLDILENSVIINVPNIPTANNIQPEEALVIIEREISLLFSKLVELKHFGHIQADDNHQRLDETFEFDEGIGNIDVNLISETIENADFVKIVNYFTRNPFRWVIAGN